MSAHADIVSRLAAMRAAFNALRPRVVSLNYSGGKASEYLLWLLLRGEICVPEGAQLVVCCANPGMENPTTHVHTAAMELRCRDRGIPFLRCNKSLYDEMLAAKGLGRTRFDFPAFYTKNKETGSIGMMTQRCTKEFKIAPMDRIVRNWMDANLNISKRSKRIGEKILCRWIGFTYDEATRIKSYECPKYQYFDYPLVNLRITEAAVIEGFKRINEPCPPRSVCSACFANDAAYFKMLYETQPAAWLQAVTVDEYIRDLSQFGMRDECYVYAGCIPLTELQRLGFPDLVRAQGKCHTGHCWI